jgi:apolipoprotein N-acyltransferase
MFKRAKPFAEIGPNRYQAEIDCCATWPLRDHTVHSIVSCACYAYCEILRLQPEVPYAGDWLKYGYVDEAMQSILSAAAAAGVVVHTCIAIAAAQLAAERARTAVLPKTAIAFAKGFFCGTPELLLVLAHRAIRDGHKEFENTERDES